MSCLDAPPTHLRTFLKELLSNKMFAYCIEWADESQGIFRILNSEEVARFWGIRKNRPKMNYDKLSRSLRFYYKKGLLKKVPGQRLVYQFTEPNADTADEGKTDLKESNLVKSSKWRFGNTMNYFDVHNLQAVKRGNETGGMV